MECYRCESADLVLAPLWTKERRTYAEIDIVMRICLSCGLEQNHIGHDEPLTACQASNDAPSNGPLGSYNV